MCHQYISNYKWADICITASISEKSWPIHVIPSFIKRFFLLQCPLCHAMEPSSASWKGQRLMGFPVTDHGVVWRKSCVTAFRLDWIFHIRFYSGVKLMHCAIDIGQHWWRTGLSPDCSNHFFRKWSIFVDMIFKGTTTSHYLRQWWPVVTYVFTEAWLIITSFHAGLKFGKGLVISSHIW